MSQTVPLKQAIKQVTDQQLHSGKPLAIIMAGHNGSGKSTLWYEHLAEELKIPLINADRMMLSILPEPVFSKPTGKNILISWAQTLRDKDERWMEVAQKGVEAFVAQAKLKQVPFAVETVFSYWEKRPDGTYASKIDLIQQLQDDNYFVLLIFVGLANVNLSIGRVFSRSQSGGHDVEHEKLTKRFPRTQYAIGAALDIADAAVLVDNSFSENLAFRPVHIRLQDQVLYDHRDEAKPKKQIRAWLDIVAPQH
jgi:predicted ABC-type ATPase